MEKIKWGLLSTAKIGLEKMGPAIKKSQRGELRAIASRQLVKAREAATLLDIPGAYGTYEELLADEEIQAVYIPLPNHMHLFWTQKALEAGKHVLCEKPLTPSLEDTQKFIEMTKSYPKYKVMEAFMYRFHPQWEFVKNIIRQGKIGELRNLHSDFCYFNKDARNIRNIKEYGGGGLLDIGCYNISFSRFIFEEEPIRVSGTVEFDPQFKTDRLATGILQFSKGTASFTCSTQLVPHQAAFIHGTEGSIEIPVPFTPANNVDAKIYLIHNNNKEEFSIKQADQYTVECDEFCRSIIEDIDVPTSLSDALNNIKVIQSVFQSSKTGEWVKL